MHGGGEGGWGWEVWCISM